MNYKEKLEKYIDSLSNTEHYAEWTSESQLSRFLNELIYAREGGDCMEDFIWSLPSTLKNECLKELIDDSCYETFQQAAQMQLERYGEYNLFLDEDDDKDIIAVWGFEDEEYRYEMFQLYCQIAEHCRDYMMCNYDLSKIEAWAYWEESWGSWEDYD